ncbi:MAG: hypothetical protein ACYCWA_00055 [Thiobacillus sp.]
MAHRHSQALRRAKTTVLIVGEGDTEKAFLDHLRTHYVTRGCGVSVTTRNAHGKGPENIVDVAIRHAKGADYSIVAVLMDTDLPWTPALRKLAQTKKICLIGASPCCDGLLLGILGDSVPGGSDHCKAKLLQRLGKKPVVKEAYANDFTKALLDVRRDAIKPLDKILTLMAGARPESD